MREFRRATHQAGFPCLPRLPEAQHGSAFHHWCTHIRSAQGYCTRPPCARHRGDGSLAWCMAFWLHEPAPLLAHQRPETATPVQHHATRMGGCGRALEFSRSALVSGLKGFRCELSISCGGTQCPVAVAVSLASIPSEPFAGLVWHGHLLAGCPLQVLRVFRELVGLRPRSRLCLFADRVFVYRL